MKIVPWMSTPTEYAERVLAAITKITDDMHPLENSYLGTDEECTRMHDGLDIDEGEDIPHMDEEFIDEVGTYSGTLLQYNMQQDHRHGGTAIDLDMSKSDLPTITSPKLIYSWYRYPKAHGIYKDEITYDTPQRTKQPKGHTYNLEVGPDGIFKDEITYYSDGTQERTKQLIRPQPNSIWSRKL